MLDRGKVIEGLTFCKQRYEGCGGCPGFECWVEEAIPMIEAQEPRVMTLEEAYNAECVWYDQKNTGIRPAKVNRVPHKTGVYRVMRFGDIDAWEHADEYGEYWRCWTSRPTDEQREATPWEKS